MTTAVPEKFDWFGSVLADVAATLLLPRSGTISSFWLHSPAGVVTVTVKNEKTGWTRDETINLSRLSVQEQKDYARCKIFGLVACYIANFNKTS